MKLPLKFNGHLIYERSFKRALVLVWLSVSFFLFSSFFQQNRIVYSVLKGTIQFKSDAALEIIDAKSDALRGFIDASQGDFAFAVNITSFEGFNAALQREHFNEKYMESSVYPTATFKGKIIEEIDWTKNGNYQVRAKGILNIHGVEQERIIKVNLTLKNGLLLLNSKFSVFLKDHNIKIPRVVHEKVASEIIVDINVEMGRK